MALEKWNFKNIDAYSYIYENPSPFLYFLEFLRIRLHFRGSLCIGKARELHSAPILILVWELRHCKERKRSIFLQRARHMQVALYIHS